MGRSKQFQVLIVAAGLLATGCANVERIRATQMTPADAEVRVLRIAPLTCSNVKTETLTVFNDRGAIKAQAAKFAVKEGLRHVVVRTLETRDRDERKFQATLLECPFETDAPSAELTKLCDGANATACLELASRALFAFETPNTTAAREFASKSCTLKNAVACEVQKEIEKAIAVKAARQAKEDRCRDKRDGDACLDLLAESSKTRDREAEIEFAQLACLAGRQNGCELHRNFSMIRLEEKKIKQAERHHDEDMDARRRASHDIARAIANTPRNRNCTSTRLGNSVDTVCQDY